MHHRDVAVMLLAGK